MKKALPYAATAILLGTVMMLAPLMLIGPSDIQMFASGDGENIPKYCAQIRGETLGEGDALERVAFPSNLTSAGLMLIPSFILALGVSLYLKKRMF